MVKSSSPDNRLGDIPERPILLPLAELAFWLILFAIPIFAFSFAATGSVFLPHADEMPDWWFVKVGEAFFADAGWLLPTVLAIVLSFYGALIGQSVVNAESDAIYKTRRRLVRGGLALASVVIWFNLAAIAAAIVHSDRPPQLPGIILISISIVLLGVGIGRYRTRSHLQELKLVGIDRADALARLERLAELAYKGGSRTPDDGKFVAFVAARPLVTVAVNVAVAWIVLAAPFIAVALAASIEDGALVLFLRDFFQIALTCVIGSTILCAQFLAFKGPISVVGKLVNLCLLGTTIFLPMLSIIDTGGPEWFPIVFAIASATAFAVISISAFGLIRKRRFFVLTLNSAAIEFRRKLERREVSALSKRIEELERIVEY